jgi:hypothetical protein
MKLWSTTALLSESQLRNAADYTLTDWSEHDKNQENRDLAKAEIERRKSEAERKAEEAAAKERAALAAKRDRLAANPFDPRTEISEDARHIASRIVTHLWILFVLLPFCAFILLAIAGLIR